MSPRPFALVRPPSAAFVRALRRDPASRTDPTAANVEHAAYVEALTTLAEVRVLPPEDELPDSCFVEDVVVVVGNRAMLTRPGAPSRRPEVERIRACLPSWVTIVDQTTGTLDGGDVLRVGSTLFVGRSDRTDDSGIAALAAAFPEMNVVPVLVPGALHLKCHATALDADHVLVAEGFLPAQAFRGIAQPVWVPPDEAYAANVVVVGGSALVAAGYPKTRARVEAHGLRAIPLSMRAFSAADGSLTCLSVILDSGLERSGA